MELIEFIDFKALLIAALVFIPLERVVGLRREQKILRRQWLSDLVYAVVNPILIKGGLIVIFALLLGVLVEFIPNGLHQFIGSQPLWLQIIEVFLIADLGFYLAHRAFHAIPVLWRFHAVHHSIEEMDWLAAHRVHPIDQIVTKAASLLPVFALGFSGPAILTFAAVYQWHSLLIHSNVNIPFGPLRWLVASPQFHHWHHGNQPEAYNTNFAGQLPFIDWIFGTLYLPRKGTPKKYGVDEKVPTNCLGQFAYPFVRTRPAQRDRAPAGEQARTASQ